MKHDAEDPFAWPPADAGGASRPLHGEVSPEQSSGESDTTPPTEPSTSVVPPSRLPPTALSAPALPPPVRWEERRVVIGSSFDLLAVVNRVLDTLDVVGDTIAEAAGIRARNG